ncbi:uncharacterized protein LOC116248220 isoform X1 [Nymphaea colorata]|nr:uncharacterized protein LOC116248220 isoform X1 [Nymphaea colorata]
MKTFKKCSLVLRNVLSMWCNVELGIRDAVMEVCVDEGDDDLWCEDSASDGYRDDGRDRKSELDREWKRRQNQFHTIGYRDGLMAGKEASAQEGFNAGFRESVVPGYNWGLVRGIISTLSCLPDELKEKLIGRSDKRDELQALYEATHSVSSNQALIFFHDDIMNRKPLDSGSDSSGGLIQPNVLGDASYCGKLESFKEKLKSVVSESTASGITAILESNIAG